jgi:hypothetical protein
MINKDILSSHITHLLLITIIFSLSTAYNIHAQQKSDKRTVQLHDSTLKMRREMIHSRSSMVMPFNMNKVTHYFIKTKDGGTLMIKAKNGHDTVQINLIRKHLKKEHVLFSNADFRDPMTLHGVKMPGLKVLTSSKGKFKVVYKKLSDGAELILTSADLNVIKALHTWFNAQLKDHGRDAKSSD